MEYVINHEIMGRENEGSFLYCACGKDKIHAEDVLNRIINNPNSNDRYYLEKGYCNFKIVEVDDSQCWWYNT